MPQHRAKTSKRWYSSKYAQGYCFKRGDRVWVRIADFRETTGLWWDEKNKAAALEYLDAFLAKFYNGTVHEVDAISIPGTVYALIKDFKKTRLVGKSEDVLVKFRTAVKYYFPKDVDFTQAAILEALREANANTLAQGTRRKYLQNLNMMFRYAVENDYLKKNPIALIGIPSKPKKAGNLVLKPEQVQSLIGHFHSKNTRFSKEHALIIEWLWRTGMRVGEAVQMKWSDYENGVLKIVGKGSIYREFPVYLFPEAAKVLEQMKEYSFQGGKIWRWEGTQNIQYNFKLAKEELHLPEKATVHTLRASAGWYFENVLNLDITLVAELLGHSVAINVMHYRKKRTIEEIAKILKNTPQDAH